MESQRAARILSHVVGTHDVQQQTVSNNATEDVVILGIARTPLGSFQGNLSSLQAVELGSFAIKAALERSGVKSEHVQAVYMGNVLQADEGQAPARQAALGAGLPSSVPCTTVNKVCASGMKAIMMAASDIKLGIASVAIAGGMESMSNAPYYLPRARQGLRMGDAKTVDGMMKDGLTDPYGKCAMGVLAEKCAEKQKVSRTAQDAYALLSYKRAAKAWTEGKFNAEVVPIKVKTRKGDVVVKEDEDYKKVDFDAIPKLKPAFGGKTVTAGNSSTLSDGAAALVLASSSYAKQHGLKPIAVVRSWADAATIPEDFPIAPSLAVPLALERAKLTKDDVDFFELNEAFAVVAEANCKILGIPTAKVNVNGGSVSIGHPLGCSGARIVVTLASVLQQNNARYGCAGICNGGGGASALVIERIQ
eukprot:TRINITY_DN9563_c0_g1_i1.p2 TRINITY_DN9563_c0_g1~~TRINITY_DN9563_c0_g1_i1.p2  ORF type:complete len:433 (-),score=129.98 TRINITY_DN9563_c0_g1_i1:1770-3029(-)